MWMDPFLTIKSPNKYIIYPVTLISQEGLFKTSLSYRFLTWPLTFPGFCFSSVLLWSSFHPSPLPTIPLTTPTERYTQHPPLSNVFFYTWLSPGSCLQWVWSLHHNGILTIPCIMHGRLLWERPLNKIHCESLSATLCAKNIHSKHTVILC